MEIVGKEIIYADLRQGEFLAAVLYLRVKSSGASGGEMQTRCVRITENNATYSGIRVQGDKTEKISAQKAHGGTLGSDRG